MVVDVPKDPGAFTDAGRKAHDSPRNYFFLNEFGSGGGWGRGDEREETTTRGPLGVGGEMWEEGGEGEKSVYKGMEQSVEYLGGAMDFLNGNDGNPSLIMVQDVVAKKLGFAFVAGRGGGEEGAGVPRDEGDGGWGAGKPRCKDKITQTTGCRR